MPGAIDLVVAAMVAIVYPIWDYFNALPRMRRTVASGRPNARVSVYVEVIAVEWLITAIIVAVWTYAGRPWHLVGLVLPAGWALVLTAALIAALLMLFRTQMSAIRRLDPAKRDRVRARQSALALLIPHTPIERAWFVPTAITAGLCEEFMYRGFLIWAFRPWLGVWGAALASTVSFGLAHAYQGRPGPIRAGAIGAVFAVLTIATGSIIPGMVLHALLDLISGEASYAIFAERAPDHAAA